MDEIETSETAPAFEISTVNEFLARARPVSRPLFGDMWLEGELAVMFAEAGCGKSVLAVQIADSIARGAAFKPLEARPRRQKVVYLDLESAAEHFCSRYRHDDGGFKPHKFPANFIHARLTGAFDPTVVQIEEVIEKTGAKVLVIDNLAHLMTGHSSNETARIMRELRRLCRRDGISILLLVHSPPANLRRGIEARDLPFGPVISAFADNVFAVGRVGAAASERYIKHLRPGPAAHVFGAAHVPWFRIRKRSNFTYFEFRGFAREGALRLSDGDRREWQLIDRVAELKRIGMPVRSIAKALEMSKTTVQKYAMMCPDEPRPELQQAEYLPPDEADVHGDESYAFDIDPEDQDVESDLRSYWLRRGFEPLDAADIPAEEDAVFEFYSDPEDPETPYESLCEKATDREAPAEVVTQHPVLERDIDSNDREIWVEKRDSRGRRIVWYLAQTNLGVPTGKYTRYEDHGLAGILGNTVDHLPTGEAGRAPP